MKLINFVITFFLQHLFGRFSLSHRSRSYCYAPSSNDKTDSKTCNNKKALTNLSSFLFQVARPDGKKQTEVARPDFRRFADAKQINIFHTYNLPEDYFKKEGVFFFFCVKIRNFET